MAPATFLASLDDVTGVATLTLNRPDRLNALTFDVYAELRDTFDVLGENDAVRSIVLTGAGRGFCSGGDVHEIIGALVGREPDALLEFTRLTCELIWAIRQCPKPVVAAVNGIAAGAGAVIASACDIRIAASSASFAFLFTRVGLSGADMGAAWLLPRLVGFGRASELLMTGDAVTAAEAHRIGLVNRVVADAGLHAAAQALAGQLAEGPAAALADTKQALNDEASLTLDQALDVEAARQAALMEGPDFREAFTAFRERRAPRFR
ncbi:MAG: enoyl-CoA hydratase family protein [Vicinamibacterales bacterium]